MYKIGKKQCPAAVNRVAEQARDGAGVLMVVGSNPTWSIFFSVFKKFLNFLAG